MNHRCSHNATVPNPRKRLDTYLRLHTFYQNPPRLFVGSYELEPQAQFECSTFHPADVHITECAMRFAPIGGT